MVQYENLLFWKPNFLPTERMSREGVASEDK